MKLELSDAKMLSPTEMSELSARLDVLHAKTLAAIDRLQKDVATQKARILRHWEGVSALGPLERQRVMTQQLSSAIAEIRQNSKDELDRILINAGASHTALVAQRPYYASKAAVLNRQGLGTDRRTKLERTAELARQVALASLAQLAIGTEDLVLAAAVVNENDRRRDSERSFSTAEFLSLMPGLDEFTKAQQYILIGENRMTALVLAIRTWQDRAASADRDHLARAKQARRRRCHPRGNCRDRREPGGDRGIPRRTGRSLSVVSGRVTGRRSVSAAARRLRRIRAIRNQARTVLSATELR
jgi:hypothetical protein